MLNRVTLTGRTTKDVELKYTQSGKAVGSFNLAVNRRFKSGNGDHEADFIQCVIWGKSAENFANYVRKGNLVGIDGRIQTRNYENNQGNRVYVTEVVVENFSFLESKGSQQNNQHANGGFSNSNNQYMPKPPQNSNFNQNNNDPFGNNDGFAVSDDDLPF